MQIAEGETSMPTISVVIPTYNATDTIERALNSVYAQSYPNIIEVIVVDDGSTDETANTVADAFPQATIIRQENRGCGAARNAGVKAAKGQHIAFLDADDEWTPEHIAAMVGVKRWCVGAGLLLCQEFRQMTEGAVDLKRPWLTAGLYTFDFRDCLNQLNFALGFSSCPSGWLISRELFNTVGGFDESLMPVDDVEFMLRLSSLGFTIVGVTHPGFTVYWREHSMSRGGVGPTRSALTLCDVIRPFAPSGSSGANTILTPGEYQAFLKKALCAAAQSLVAGGRLKEAQELFREARFLQGGSLQMRLGVTLGALMPRLVGWFSSRFWFSLRRTLFRRQLAKRLSQTR